MLVASQTGGGKSTFEKCLITSFILKKLPLYLVDMKNGAEFHVFEPSRNVKRFGTTINGAEETIEAFQAEINRRYQLFYDSNVKDIATLHKKGGKLPYSFLMIDEFATLTKSKCCMEMLYDILARGRAAGCLAIIATQHPSYEIIPGLLKANFCQTVAFRVKVPLYSEIILGCQGAEKLKGNGHGLFQCGDDLTEFQSPYIDDDIITPLIQHTFGKKDEKVIYGGFKC
jgi:S-DNA-T family DNA segregation ATPase FtsK/SpoIIIE